MINNRVLFGFMPLLLALIISISSAPLPNTQLIASDSVQTETTTVNSFTYDDDISIESDEILDETSTIVAVQDEQTTEDLETTTTITAEDTETTTEDFETTTEDVLVKNTTQVPFDIDEIIRVANQIFAGSYEPLATTSESP